MIKKANTYNNLHDMEINFFFHFTINNKKRLKIKLCMI